jgi:hypothetical protein
MLLIIYALLSLVPLLGIVWILAQASITTVDGLFMSLICLSISGILAANAFFEYRKYGLKSARYRPRPMALSSSQATLAALGALIEQGRVEDVVFFESHIGQPNKSLVTLSDGGGAQRMLVLEGDVRNALPVGKQVEIASREDSGRKVLLGVTYA